MSTAFNAWVACCHHSRKQDALTRRVLTRMVRVALAKSLDQWMDYCAQLRHVRSILSRMQHQRASRSFGSWVDVVELCLAERLDRQRDQAEMHLATQIENQRQKTLAQIMGRWRLNGLSRCFGSWRSELFAAKLGYSAQRRNQDVLRLEQDKVLVEQQLQALQTEEQRLLAACSQASTQVREAELHGAHVLQEKEALQTVLASARKQMADMGEQVEAAQLQAEQHYQEKLQVARAEAVKSAVDAELVEIRLEIVRLKDVEKDNETLRQQLAAAADAAALPKPTPAPRHHLAPDVAEALARAQARVDTALQHAEERHISQTAKHRVDPFTEPARWRYAEHKVNFA
jgi:hypothetical protein